MQKSSIVDVQLDSKDASGKLNGKEAWKIPSKSSSDQSKDKPLVVSQG